MYEIVSALKSSPLFTSIDVMALMEEDSVKLIRLKASVVGGTSLYITELHTSAYQRYSYHWQEEDGALIIRWDNKPHWKQMATFPYHKHVKNRVLPSHRVTINDVIETMKKNIAGQDNPG